MILVLKEIAFGEQQLHPQVFWVHKVW